jgi:hypothetical protein
MTPLWFTDWLPTLMHVATDGQWTGSLNGTELDGVDQWDAISTLGDSPRSEIVFYAGEEGSAIQMGDLRYYVTSTGEPDVSTVDYVFAADSGSSESNIMCEDVSLVSSSSRSASQYIFDVYQSVWGEDVEGSSKLSSVPVSFIVGMVVIGTILLVLFKCLEMQTAKKYDQFEVTKAEEVPLYYHLDGDSEK